MIYEGRWAPLATPSPMEWRRNEEFKLDECYIADILVAWIEPRPAYCDRGRFKMLCDLPDIDAQDGFPRYYMTKATAMLETQLFLMWRLWKIRAL